MFFHIDHLNMHLSGNTEQNMEVATEQPSTGPGGGSEAGPQPAVASFRPVDIAGKSFFMAG